MVKVNLNQKILKILKESELCRAILLYLIDTNKCASFLELSSLELGFKKKDCTAALNKMLKNGVLYEINDKIFISIEGWNSLEHLCETQEVDF